MRERVNVVCQRLKGYRKTLCTRFDRVTSIIELLRQTAIRGIRRGRVVIVRDLEPGVLGSIPSSSGHGEVPLDKAQYLIEY